MNESQRYSTARAFRQALEARLQVRARAAGVDVGRLRKQVAFDCFLTRLFPSGSDEAGWVLKGGYALELRFLHARATKDIDLTLSSGVIQTSTFEEQRLRLREHIRSYASRTLPDFFEYFIGSSTLDLEGAPEGGFRFPVEATMDGRVFANFHVDIGVGDATDPPLEILRGGDWLEFAGIARPQFVAVSREQQWAEKLHAYTRPRVQRPNSRTKDLVDLVLLIEAGGLSAERLLKCVAKTFERRASQPVPHLLPFPPAEWNSVFARLAMEAGITADMTEAFEILAAYWKAMTTSEIS
jgi:hypothetical protein